MTKSLEKQLNGWYTRLLRMVFNVHWKEYVTNEELFGTMMKVADKIQERRMRFAGHNLRQAGTPGPKIGRWCDRYRGVEWRAIKSRSMLFTKRDALHHK